MNWRLLTWKDIAGFLTVAVIASAMIHVFVGLPNQIRPTNFDFGPDGSCTHIPNGEPVCVKKFPAQR